MYNIFELNEKSLNDLKIIATEMGIDDENRDRRNFATVRFCDYASAGNRWSPANWYRTWLPVSFDTMEALAKPE